MAGQCNVSSVTPRCFIVLKQSLKTPVLPSKPSKPLKDTSRLNGRAYVAAGQAGAALHDVGVAGIPG